MGHTDVPIAVPTSPVEHEAAIIRATASRSRHARHDGVNLIFSAFEH
jgi:hypothetical protein